MNANIAVLILCMELSATLCSYQPYKISDEDYYKLPELFVLENYDKCLSQKDSVYCVGSFELHAESHPSELYDVLKSLTDDTLINFNHTKIYRASCLGEIGRCALNASLPREQSFENCIDREIREEFGLRARLAQLDYCKTRQDNRKFDTLDLVCVTYLATIVLLNIIGTVYDISKNDGSRAQPFLLSFSLRRNWKKLTNTSASSGDHFGCFHGMRAILTVLVHIAHTIMALVIGFIPNPRYIELISDHPELNVFYNGTLVIQTFIVMTSFLRTLKTFHDIDSPNLGFKTILNAAIERYVRIAPIFITAVALSATLVPHLGDGPLWRKFVDGEADLCRDTFWRQILLIQNFYPPSCHPQAWYLSVDFQVYVLTTAITVYLAKKKNNIAKILAVLLMSSLVLVFIIVYSLELKPSLLIMKPENLMTSFKYERSFYLLYQSLWGNLPSALVGIVTACLYLKIHTSKYDLKSDKIFVYLYKSSIPAAFAYAAIGIFIMFEMSSSVTVSLYGTLDKPVYGVIMGVFILGCIFKVDDLYRNVIEWQGWVVLSRLSLTTLMMHVIVNRVLTSNRLYPLNASVANVMADGFGVSVMTFMLSLPLSLMIEYPFLGIYKIITTSKPPNHKYGANGMHLRSKDN